MYGLYDTIKLDYQSNETVQINLEHSLKFDVNVSYCCPLFGDLSCMTLILLVYHKARLPKSGKQDTLQGNGNDHHNALHRNKDVSNIGMVSLSQMTESSGDDIDRFSVFLSQPTSLQDMLLSTQLLNTQTSSTQNCMQKLVRRLTRFVVELDVKTALGELNATLDKFGLIWKLNTSNQITITTVDKRRNQLVFKTNIFKSINGTLLDFRLSRGCGLEFKRHFVTIRTELKKYIVSNVKF